MFQDDGVLIESMDACMGLARKKCKGSSGLIEPRHGELFFSDQVDVDNFVDNYGKYGEKNIEVLHNHFKVHLKLISQNWVKFCYLSSCNFLTYLTSDHHWKYM